MADNSQAVTNQQPQNQMKAFFMQEAVQRSIKEIMKERTPQFVTTILQIANSNDLLKNADPITVMNAALTAAVMNLPINPNLGYAYLVPYKNNKTGKIECQFQMGAKGFVQLAQRTSLFKTINVEVIYSNQIEEYDYLTGEFSLVKGAKPTGEIAGYIAYFRLLNGFEKALFMSKEQMNIHAKKYSQSFKKGYGVWAEGEDGFNAMGKKTVLKLLLSKYAPLSTEMEKAVVFDQAVIRGTEPEDITYVDNSSVTKADIDPEIDRLQKLMNACKTIPELQELKKSISSERVDLLDMVSARIDELQIQGA